MLLLGLAVAAAWLVYARFFRGLFSFWRRRGVPGPACAVPFGNFADAVLAKKGLGDVAVDVYHKFRNERYVGTQFITTPLLHIHDPEIIRQVFIKEFQDFNGRGMYCDPKNDPISGHLFILSGAPWRNMRVKLSPTFTTGKMKYMFNTIRACGDSLGQHVASQLSAAGGSYEEDVKELLARLGTDIITSVAFGVESNSVADGRESEFRRMGASVLDPSFDSGMRGMFMFFWPAVMRTFGIRVMSSEPYSFFMRTVREMVEYRERNGVERADFLNLLIKLKNEGFVPPDTASDAARDADGADANGREPANKAADSQARQKLTLDEIAAQCVVFFLAGFETTSATTMFVLYMLCKHPDIQQRLRDEMTEAVDRHGGQVTYDALMDLPYADMVIKETLRLFPAVPFLTREAMRPRTLPLTDLQLDKGQRLLIPVLALHKDPKYWDNPEEFNPERFTKEMEATRHPMVYLPFGDGPRICIGMRMAMVQTKMALFKILSQVTVSLPPESPSEVKLSPLCITPTPAETLKIVFTARR